MAKKKKAKVKVVTMEDVLAQKVRAVKQGVRHLTFDPQHRIWVNAIADQLTQQFHQYAFAPHPGRVGDWPVIYVREIKNDNKVSQ